MALAAEAALRAWINAKPVLPADPNLPAWRGAYLREQRSPADGAYAVLARGRTAVQAPVAENSPLTLARIECSVYAGTVLAAEAAAAALRTLFESLTGCPEPCGVGTGAQVMVADNFTGPEHVPVPADTGEVYCFQVGADFLLTAY